MTSLNGSQALPPVDALVAHSVIAITPVDQSTWSANAANCSGWSTTGVSQLLKFFQKRKLVHDDLFSQYQKIAASVSLVNQKAIYSTSPWSPIPRSSPLWMSLDT